MDIKLPVQYNIVKRPVVKNYFSMNVLWIRDFTQLWRRLADASGSAV